MLAYAGVCWRMLAYADAPVRAPRQATASVSLRSDPASPASPADLADTSELPLLAAGGGAGGRLSDEAVRGAQSLCAVMVARLQEVVRSQEEECMLKVFGISLRY